MATDQPHSADYFGEARDYWWNSDFIELMGRRLDLGAAGRVLDVGAGIGHWGRALAPALSASARLVGVDREDTWVAEATRRAERAGLAERFTYQRGDATALPFASETFDVVTCQTVLIHVPDPAHVLGEMLRVCKPGGLVLAVEPNNLANVAVQSSLSAQLPSHALVDTWRFHLVCQRGKQALGLGFNSVGDLVPGMLAALGAQDVRVYIGDRASPLFPPYAGREQAAEVAQFMDFVKREVWAWDHEETLRYFLAGGGAEAEFTTLWDGIGAQERAVADAIRAGTYATAGGCLSYLVSGRKPAGP